MSDEEIHRRAGGPEFRLFGPPGTGKTTTLSKMIASTARARGSESVIAASFTVTAAQELAGRDLPIPKRNVGTLHSLAYRSIGSDRRLVAEEIVEWNKKHPSFSLTLSAGARSQAIDDGVPVENFVGSTDGDKLLGEMEKCRARMINRDLWPRDVRQFAEAWEHWKADEDLIDFTDMIELALLESPTAPGNPEVGFFDEVQDFTRLELSLIRKWGAAMERIILAGDDDQCAPGDQMVLTSNRGEVRIDEIVEGVDRLVSYDRNSDGEMRLAGYDFQRGVRDYTGELVVMTTDTTRCRVTHDHRVLARWTPAAADAWCVYLMRKGDWWRIGKTRVHQSGAAFRPAMRARQEGADALWILGVFEDEGDALWTEQYLSTTYGITQAMWRVTNGVRQFKVTEPKLKDLHDRLAAEGSGERAHRMLATLGLDVSFPFWPNPDATQMGSAARFKIRACNLISGWMEVPTWTGGPSEQRRMVAPRDGRERVKPQSTKQPEWLTATVTREHVERMPVYSLNVAPHHFYVGCKQVLPQCLYRFKGASPDAFLDPPVDDIDKRVLAQSYRVPSKVHAAAEDWVLRLSRREPKEYLPRDEPGEVGTVPVHYQDAGAFVNEIEFRLAAHAGDVMVLAPCGYMLDPVKHELKARGVPFHNPFRLKRGDWNPMRPSTSRTIASKDRLAAYLIIDETMFGELARLWTGRDLQRWTHVVKSQGVFVKGAKDRIGDLAPDDIVPFPFIESLFADEATLEQAVTPSIDWLDANLLAANRDAMRFPITVARKYGGRALTDTPRVILGTIHSVKGGQADTVLLVPDLSAAGGQEWIGPPGEARDSVVRQMYVGMTRARERLLVCQPSTTRSIAPHELLRGAPA